jgi:hypothetical protein
MNYFPPWTTQDAPVMAMNYQSPVVPEPVYPVQHAYSEPSVGIFSEFTELGSPEPGLLTCLAIPGVHLSAKLDLMYSEIPKSHQFLWNCSPLAETHEFLHMIETLTQMSRLQLYGKDGTILQHNEIMLNVLAKGNVILYDIDPPSPKS